MYRFPSEISLKKKRLPSIACGIALAGLIGFSSCSPVTRQEDFIEETTVLNYTQGIVTQIEEVEKDVFKITDETTVDTQEDSRIIATYLDGERDTFRLEEMQLADADTSSHSSSSYRRRSSINSVVYGGLMGYFMGRSMSNPTNPNVYSNTAVYNKSTTTTSSALKSTANTTTTRTSRPSSGSSGFGGGKSTRSYGG